MQTTMVHFLRPYGLSTKYNLFKCRITKIINLIKKYLWIKIANLNKNIYKGVKFNKHTPSI
jgi:hypothetical protein